MRTLVISAVLLTATTACSIPVTEDVTIALPPCVEATTDSGSILTARGIAFTACPDAGTVKDARD